MIHVTTIAVIGASGMLGSMVSDVLSRDPDTHLICIVRTNELAQKGRETYENIDWRILDAEACDIDDARKAISGAEYVINAVGIIKPYVHDDNPDEVLRATRVNSLFPHVLGHVAAAENAKVLQIATDCVYSGSKGMYTEEDPHDALDVYGKTKSLGEAYLPSVFNIRCSIIGPELKSHLSLMDWFLGQPNGAKVNGYTNHEWNGVTTYHFARICQGIIEKDMNLPHIQHLVPKNILPKSELLGVFARNLDREDITITPVEAKVRINRTLATKNESLNREIWAAVGYSEPPTIEEMVTEMAGHMEKMG